MTTLHIWTDYQQSEFDEAKGRSVAQALTSYGFERDEARKIAAQIEARGEANYRCFTIRPA